MEEPDVETEDDNYDKDVDSKLSDDRKCEHEEDDEVLSTKRPVDDPFLRVLCSVNTNVDYTNEKDVGFNHSMWI